MTDPASSSARGDAAPRGAAPSTDPGGPPTGPARGTAGTPGSSGIAGPAGDRAHDDGPDRGAGPDGARAAVVRRTARRCRQFPELEIGPLEGLDADLDPRDAALAGAIDHAIARRWLTLEALLAPRARRGWDRVEPRLRAVLMVGAAQLMLLDRIPEHAAIHSSVELARSLVRPGAAGITNAILRGLARDRLDRLDHFDPAARDQVPLPGGGAWRLRGEPMPADPVDRLAAQCSIGRELLGRWYAAFGREAAEGLALHTLVEPPITLTGIPPQPPRADEPQPILRPHAEDGFHVLDAPRETLDALLREHPAARVQDAVSAKPVAATAGLAPRRILDACAGRGTKTRQLRALHPEATIVAAELDAERLQSLRAIARGDARTTAVPWSRVASMDETFDLVVLDVPCSNTGVLARRPEAKYRATDEAIDGLVATQRQIVADTLRLLEPGGHLLYATCSLEPAENEQQVAWMTRWHPLELVEQAAHRPAGMPGDPPERYTDGGGHALLRLRAT